MTGLVLAAPSSGAGKTTITLGLLRAFRNQGTQIRGAKSGPDYIDPRFHEAASGHTCPTLDAWAMSPERIKTLAAGDGLLLIEGAMGLFDGAPNGTGSAADLADILGLPVVLIVDCARMSHSVAALVLGFKTHDPRITLAGVILNNVGSPRHETMLRAALAPSTVPIFGVVMRDSTLTHPSRHLGLVQANERPDLDDFLENAARLVSDQIDLEALQRAARPLATTKTFHKIPPPGQTIAIARDQAFAFCYPHLTQDWHDAGASITFFSPLADDPVPEADFIFLPGGYPELHAGHLAQNRIFQKTMREASEHSDIYGECGGYMMLGKGLIDADGHRHEMLGLLDLETSFEMRKLHLGYRQLLSTSGPHKGRYRGHEFHYATTLRAHGASLFQVKDTFGDNLPDMGLVSGHVSGSFAHIIDRAAD